MATEKGPVPRWKQRYLRAFLGSKFCWGREGNKPPSPGHNPLRVMWGQRAGKGIGEGVRNSLFRTFCPHPHPKFTGSPGLLPLRAPLFSPAPSPPPPRPNLSPIPSSKSLSAPSSRFLPSLSRPHLSGVGGPGGWPPPQPGCGSGGGGWLCLCLGRGVGAKEATGFGGVLAPADGGEVRVGGWAHCGRNGGGLSPQLPPSLPAVSLRAGAAVAAIPPQPLPNAGWFPGRARK